MFKRKYVFETKKTRSMRYLKNLFLLLVLCFAVFSLFCAIFVMFSNNENTITNRELFNKAPDLIVVFTGDAGRIPFAIKKAQEYNQSRIFITGVYSANTVKSLLRPLQDSDKIDEKFLEIDYAARNTVENVISTLRYLQKDPSIKKVLIISHDYHIMRIKIIMNELKREDDEHLLYYAGIKTDYKKYRNLKILGKEVYKLIRTYLFLILWDTNTTPNI